MVAHVSSASDTSGSVSMTEKIIEDNEVSEVKVFLKAYTGSEHPKSLIFITATTVYKHYHFK